ncbi:type II toxin-antitoxin system Phd/YefM family antitoxin [Iodobacter fluviatilis]|uniref:Prevent-host-death protein n=1 Tax=Iodobacter fluviatilis TaxID=537 RepID=A0A377STU2_9NEIS|nr:type II toxin-antitoxin system Phd/YefM family antitoxin [Iodobacter fluviatilis]TCU81605.1 hypothetical protein EV682_1205 [Iodobacter fluviatilis]STR44795.1 Uncharacterised protein [Iodobacter fluviatilis]
MSQRVSKSKFKAQALEFFRLIESSGESVVITDHGVPKFEVRTFLLQTKKPLDVQYGSVLHFDYPTNPVAENDWEIA